MKRKYIKNKKCFVCGKEMLKAISFMPYVLNDKDGITLNEIELQCMNGKCKATKRITIYKDHQNEKIFKPIIINFTKKGGV